MKSGNVSDIYRKEQCGTKAFFVVPNKIPAPGPDSQVPNGNLQFSAELFTACVFDNPIFLGMNLCVNTIK